MSFNSFNEDVGPKIKNLNGNNENKSMTMNREKEEYNLVFLYHFFALLKVLSWNAYLTSLAHK